MSNIELEVFYENTLLNHNSNFDIFSKHLSDLSFSNISGNDFAKKYHFLCNSCHEVPKIKFIKKNKIKYICECKASPRILEIKDTFKFLHNVDEIEVDISKLKCRDHPEEKYIYYCEKCKKNICNKCIENCIDHENKIKPLILDKNTINKSKYIIQKLIEQNKSFEEDIKSEDIEDIEEDNIPTFKLIPGNNFDNTNKHNIENENNQNNISNKDNYFLIENKNKDIKIDINEEDMDNIINENNNDEIKNEQFYSSSLFSLIIDDYKNYPNYNHIKTISNVEKYISLSFGDYNEINLRYEFREEKIQYNSFELFGEVFVNNNKENIFLIINEKIMELK